MRSKEYEPFSVLFFEEKTKASLIHSILDEKQHIFQERSEDGWTGNGYDWASLAKVVLQERASHLLDEVGFDAQESMFEAYGDASTIAEFALILKNVYDDDELLRDCLSRAELDINSFGYEEMEIEDVDQYCLER